MAPDIPGPDATGLAPAPDLDAEYRQAREECALHVPDDRAWITVSGPDAAEYLQGQITNDVEALEPGTGCYALLLNRKGRVQAEMRILRTGDETFLIETGTDQEPGLSRHLGMYKIGRKVELEAADRATLVLLGPGTPEVTGTAPGPEHAFSTVTIAGAECLAVSTPSGLDLVCASEDGERVRAELERKHAIPISDAAVEIVRVESGRPRFGREMADTTMPAEAGVVDRAVNFEKGCYIGQEPVARLHYRGRPNRHLRGLRFTGPAASGDPVRLGDRELGTVGTAVISPAKGWIGLAILRREAEPGSTVVVTSEQGENEAEVIELPFGGAT